MAFVDIQGFEMREHGS